MLGLCFVLMSSAFGQPVSIPFDDEDEDEDDELILKLLDPEEKWCPAMGLGEAVQLELGSALTESTQGIVAATVYKLDQPFLLPSERRARLIRQLNWEDRLIIDAMEYFLDAGAALFTQAKE